MALVIIGDITIINLKKNIDQYLNHSINISKLPSEINGIKITYCDNIIGRLGDSVSGLRGTGACCFSIWDVLDIDEYNRTGNGHTDKPVVHVNGYTYGVTYDPFCNYDNEWNGYIYRMADNEDKNFVQYIGSFNLSNLIKPANHASGIDSKEVFDQALKLSETVFPMLKELSNVINNPQQQEAQDKQIRQQERDNSMAKDTGSRQMSSGEFAFILITAIAGLIALITEYIKLLYTMLKRASQAADTNLNLIRIKRSLTVCKKYLDIIYPIAMGQQQLNDADFKAFVSEYNNMVNSIVNSMFESKDQTFTNNANGILNSQEFKDIQRMIREIEANQSVVKSNLQKALQSGDQQSIQGMVVNTKRVNGYMSKLFTAARTDLQNAQSSYAQFNPNNATTQTMTQPQTPPQTIPQPQTPPSTQQQQGGQMMQMQ